MSKASTEKLRYPVGRFSVPDFSDASILAKAIADIGSLPERLNEKIKGLSKEDYELTYREDGWCIRELIHHMSESHMHAYIRFKWALTEDEPAIKPYFESRCANLSDYKNMPIQYSVDFLEIHHKRFAFLLNEMTPEQFDRKYTHPEWDFKLDLRTTAAIYAWHCNHHLAHIDLAKSKMG